CSSTERSVSSRYRACWYEVVTMVTSGRLIPSRGREHLFVELDVPPHLELDRELLLGDCATAGRVALVLVEHDAQAAREVVDVAEPRLVARLRSDDVGDPATVERDARRAAGDRLDRRLRERVGDRRHREDVRRRVR